MMNKYLALVAVVAAAAPSQAGEPIPYAGESVEIGTLRGVAYFSKVPGGYRVITTLADGEAGLPIRFEATLSERQRIVISVPGKVDGQSMAVEISRVGQKLAISHLQALEGE